MISEKYRDRPKMYIHGLVIEATIVKEPNVTSFYTLSYKTSTTCRNFV